MGKAVLGYVQRDEWLLSNRAATNRRRRFPVGGTRSLERKVRQYGTWEGLWAMAWARNRLHWSNRYWLAGAHSEDIELSLWVLKLPYLLGLPGVQWNLPRRANPQGKQNMPIPTLTPSCYSHWHQFLDSNMCSAHTTGVKRRKRSLGTGIVMDSCSMIHFCITNYHKT